MQIAPPIEQTSRFRHFGCPECQGALEQVHDPTTGTITYLCRIGHRYDARELLVGKELATEQLLWAALTSMDELVVILGELEERRDPAATVREYQRRREAALVQRAALEQLIARNEPVQIDDDVLIEKDPNARRRRGG